MTIKKQEGTSVDVYFGTAEELIAAGLARPEQFPGQPGNRPFSQRFYRGKATERHQRVPHDEHFLAVSVYGSRYKVEIGLARDEAQAREAACEKERTARRREWEQEERAERKERQQQEADSARASLKSMPKSAQEYRRELVRQLRSGVFMVVGMQEDLSRLHGYSLPEESQHAIKFAADALVEAAMAAEIAFDEKIHAAVVAGYQATIRAADPAFYSRLDRLTKVDPSILEGEQA